MQTVSDAYKRIIAGDHWFESALSIGESGRLITKNGERILFGGTSILVSRGGGDDGFGENNLIGIKISRSVFAGSSPVVGSCVAGEIDVQMLAPATTIPRMAQLVPYVRVCNSEERSEWIQKGVYYIDTREVSTQGGERILSIHGYDSMLKAEADFNSGFVQSNWPAKDSDVVRGCAVQLDVGIDASTWSIINKNYRVTLPEGYTVREVLGYIAAMYASCWVMDDHGQLRLIQLNGLPAQTNLLTDHVGNALVFGDTRILV